MQSSNFSSKIILKNNKWKLTQLRGLKAGTTAAVESEKGQNVWWGSQPRETCLPVGCGVGREDSARRLGPHPALLGLPGIRCDGHGDARPWVVSGSQGHLPASKLSPILQHLCRFRKEGLATEGYSLAEGPAQVVRCGVACWEPYLRYPDAPQVPGCQA